MFSWQLLQVCMPTYFASGDSPRYCSCFGAAGSGTFFSPAPPSPHDTRHNASTGSHEVMYRRSGNRVETLKEPHVLKGVDAGLVPAFLEPAFLEPRFFEEGE